MVSVEYIFRVVSYYDELVSSDLATIIFFPGMRMPLGFKLFHAAMIFVVILKRLATELRVSPCFTV
jgi:hypothetical protein